MQFLNNTLQKESALKKVQSLIRQFNATFAIEADITIDENTQEEITNGLHIKELKNDGAAFLDEMLDTMSKMVHVASDSHELVFDEKKGFALAHKKITYELDDDEEILD